MSFAVTPGELITPLMNLAATLGSDTGHPLQEIAENHNQTSRIRKYVELDVRMRLSASWFRKSQNFKWTPGVAHFFKNHQLTM